MLVEYLRNILGTNRHIKGTCIAENVESNGPLVWFVNSVLNVGGVIIYQHYIRQ